MKILLSTPPGKTTELWPPLGLLYIAASVRMQRKDEIKVIDAFCENLTPEDLTARVLKENPDVFGINCSTHTFLDAISMLKVLKDIKPDMKLVLGGYHATFAAERILRDYPFIDYILKGEAEHTFPQLLQCIEDGSSPSKIDGISFTQNDSYITNPLKLIDDLDSLPFPARDLLGTVDYGYFHQGIRLTFGKLTTICTSRGCPYKCTYCSCAELSLRKWRPRSAQNVIDEMESLYEKGYESIVFVDDNFTHRKTRVEEICKGIRERKIRMQLFCEGRVDGASYELMQQMKRAGFNVIYFGVESASQHVLDYYQKHIKPEQALKAIDYAKMAGMLVVSSYIIGAPVETRDDIQKTIDMIRKTRPHGVQLNILDCLIGTPIWDDLVKQNIVGKDDWRTNHRIYEYFHDGVSQEDLEHFVVKGYEAHLSAWKSREGIAELLRLIAKNNTARRIVLGNLFSSEVRKMIAEGVSKKPD